MDIQNNIVIGIQKTESRIADLSYNVAWTLSADYSIDGWTAITNLSNIPAVQSFNSIHFDFVLTKAKGNSQWWFNKCYITPKTTAYYTGVNQGGGSYINEIDTIEGESILIDSEDYNLWEIEDINDTYIRFYNNVGGVFGYEVYDSISGDYNGISDNCGYNLQTYSNVYVHFDFSELEQQVLDFVNTNVIINEDAYQRGYDNGYRNGYDLGYNTGYDTGRIADEQATAFTYIGQAIGGVADIMNIQVLPNMTIGLLVSIPLTIALIKVVFNMVKK